MDCSHERAVITIRHQVDRNFNLAGEQVGADVLLPDGLLTFACPDCGRRGSGNANGAGGELPRWVLDVAQRAPVVR
jgi:hypothetical protein